MRLGGFLITSGVLCIAMSVLIEGAAVARFLQDVPRLLLPLPDDRTLPVLIESRLELRAYVDGQAQPGPLVVVWSAHDGNGQLLREGSTTITPGTSTLLGRIPAGSRRELRLSAHLLGPQQPRQAYLEVRAAEASAASLALGGAGLFVAGEGLLGMGVALSVWRWLRRLARPLQVRWRRLFRRARAPRKSAKTTGQPRGRTSTGRAAPPVGPQPPSAAAGATAGRGAPEAALAAPETVDTSIPGGVPPGSGQGAPSRVKPATARAPRRKAGT